MDFDPASFLSMDMTEDQDTVYSAPDVPQGFTPEKVPTERIVVEGGLQMEQDMQISVPVFGLLQQEEPEIEEGETNFECVASAIEVPVYIDTAENECKTTPQPSPGERTSSPCNKKIIQTSLEETRFRKDLFCGHYERVKIFRLHCSTCDQHVGCAPWITERQMRTHKLLNVVVCRKCFEFYGDINFPIEDGSELFCCWCGEGGECFCCSTCAKIVCKKCVERNFGITKVKEIDKNDEWSCFVCKPEDIWPHRAIMWGLQRWNRGMRQLVAMLPKEEKQARLSMDSSHCCPKWNEEIKPVGLPSKAVLSKIPLGMIASPYQEGVKEVLLRPETYSNQSNGIFPSNTRNLSPQLVPGSLPQIPRAMVAQPVPRAMVAQPVPRAMVAQSIPRARVAQQVPRTMAAQQLPRAIATQQQHMSQVLVSQQQQMSRTMVGYHVRQMVQRNAIMMNRPAPYPMNMNMPPVVQTTPLPQIPQYAPRVPTYQTQTTYRILPSLRMTAPTEPLLDISSLESSVKEVKNVLGPTLMMLDQFEQIKNDLATDVDKLTSYSDRLSYNIKIAICNLAKANTDLIESQRKIIDSRVSSVVNSIQSAVLNNTSLTVNGTSIPVNRNTYTSVDSSPEIMEVTNSSLKTGPNLSNVEQRTPVTPLSGDEEEDVGIAMLCETVLEVGEDKENKDNANKDQTTTPVRGPQQIINKPVKVLLVKKEKWLKMKKSLVKLHSMMERC